MRKLIRILPYAFFASTTDEDKKSDFKLIPIFRQIFQNGGIFFLLNHAIVSFDENLLNLKNMTKVDRGVFAKVSPPRLSGVVSSRCSRSLF